MHLFIHCIMGPMVWISFLICITGVLFRVLKLVREVNQKERYIYTYLSFKYSLRSILAWLIPFFPASTRKKPVFYAISYLFHILLFLTPLFLLSHVLLLEESLGWSWISLDDRLADILTLLVVAALCFFIIRRMVVPEVKFLTGKTDYVFIVLVALPFVSGFIAYHQFFAYQWMVILHVISGELLLILIPFTRLFHMVTVLFTRAYTGSEFGSIRHARDW